eukprot:scaffold5565_cov134-Pinguiococcus_pyrenoidosus.AAC.1
MIRVLDVGTARNSPRRVRLSEIDGEDPSRDMRDRRSPERSRTREGDKVEARYRGRSRWYKGCIARVNRDGTFDIDYDDGEKERGVEARMIRVVQGRDPEGDDDADLEEGQRIEA